MGSPSPPAGAWARWSETFIDYVNLLPIVNNFTLTEVLKLKLLRLLLGENARRLNEASTLEDAFRQLTNFLSTDEDIFDAYIHPLYDNDEDLLYRQYLNNFLLKHSAESRNSSPLKEEISLTAKEENVERAMENLRAIVHAETQHEAALITEKTGLLEELPNECPSPSDHHSDDQFATCSVSITYSYEGTAIIDPSRKNNFPPTATGEESPIETEFQVTPTSSIVHPNRCMNVLGPAEKSGHLQNDVYPTTKPSPKAYLYRDIGGLNL